MKEMYDDKNDVFLDVPEQKFEVREDDKVIDDAFVVRKSRFGLYHSIGLDGRKWITGYTEEAVTFGTRYNLKAEIDGTLWDSPNVRIIGSALVGGKL